MAKKAHDDVIDGALIVVRSNCTRMTACVGEPTTYAEANTGGAKCLAVATMVAGDFTLSAGDVSGRKIRVGAKSGVSITATGSVDHIALLDVTNARLLYVTTCGSQVLTSGNSMSFAAWDIEIASPV
ncbi:hypothetical protein [Govanella unica]|uniref:DUF2190 family protein n=1 Tax=Govanella unica TaxID=2975056 RepID=A0A9X3Z8H3_9PROT|nr:hypothetical protein [Govania unica]MDA5194944.1 hypothetical protein [Govania unica]